MSDDYGAEKFAVCRTWVIIIKNFLKPINQLTLQ